ncbi:MAG: hypothetical protein ACE5F3_03635 [Mariprofundaceae bacterium]
MKRLWLVLALCSLPLSALAEDKEYLYFRDVNVSAYQNMRELFDLPNRPGNYEITLVSDSIGPLTFSVFRVHEDEETLIKRTRSFHLRDHEFQFPFPNRQGAYDLIVEIANSNPAGRAKVSVIVVELP